MVLSGRGGGGDRGGGGGGGGGGDRGGGGGGGGGSGLAAQGAIERAGGAQRLEPFLRLLPEGDGELQVQLGVLLAPAVPRGLHRRPHRPGTQQELHVAGCGTERRRRRHPQRPVVVARREHLSGRAVRRSGGVAALLEGAPFKGRTERLKGGPCLGGARHCRGEGQAVAARRVRAHVLVPICRSCGLAAACRLAARRLAARRLARFRFRLAGRRGVALAARVGVNG